MASGAKIQVIAVISAMSTSLRVENLFVVVLLAMSFISLCVCRRSVSEKILLAELLSLYSTYCGLY